MIHFSSALFNAWLGTSPLKTLLNACKVYVYSGPVPADANAAIDGSCVLLATISNGGTAGTFDAPTNGVLQKAAAETWAGTAVATGNASFYRLCVGSDTGATAAGASDYRVQGSIGTDASFDYKVANVAITSGGSVPMDDYELVSQQ